MSTSCATVSELLGPHGADDMADADAFAGVAAVAAEAAVGITEVIIGTITGQAPSRLDVDAMRVECFARAAAAPNGSLAYKPL